jgi:hypothetical protein
MTRRRRRRLAGRLRRAVDAIPGAQYRILAGQRWGQVAPAALAPMLRQFFL